MAEQYDVAVIGGGFAGVTAARDLSLKGYSVVLLEGRDRLGGRTFLKPAFGREVELGGTYVHWTQAHVWHELKRYGIGLVTPLPVEKTYWLTGDTVHAGTSAEFNQAGLPLIDRCLGDARLHFPQAGIAADPAATERQTIGERIDALQLSPEERDLLINMMSTLIGSEREQGAAQFLHWSAVSFGNWNAFMEVAGHWPIEGGTRRLIDAMHGESQARLKLSTTVTAIDDDGTAVIVTTHDGERIQARRAVIALPLNTLGDVRITPPVAPPVQTMISDKHPLKAAKIWARVKGEIEPFVAHAPVGKHPINTARAEFRHQGDTLVVCFCSDAAAIDGEDHAAVQQALRRFVPDIEVLDTVSHNWAADPFAQGGWVHHRPGNLTQVLPLMRKPHGRLHFAGGDIAIVGVGGIDGAIESGARAARDADGALTDERR